MCKFGGANGHLDRPQRRNLHMGHVPAMHGPKEGTDGGKQSELGLGACKDRHVGREVVAEHAMLRMLMMIAVTKWMTMMMTMMMAVTMFYINNLIFGTTGLFIQIEQGSIRHSPKFQNQIY